MSKAEQRTQALAARRALGKEARVTADAAICERLAGLPELQDACVILSYMAVGDEADLAALHALLRQRGCRLAFPVSGPAGRMEAWEPGGWRRGRYAIPEPDPASSRPVAPEEIELVLAPCVAFDESCMRLGHGAGYYDRYLPQVKAPVIAAAYEAQKLAAVDHDAYDRPMDAVVTERCVYRKKEL